jgi:hypothetical protein
MAPRKLLYRDDNEGFTVEAADGDSTTFGGLTLGGNIDMTNAGTVTNLTAPSNPTDAATKAWTEWLVATGGQWKEGLLVEEQKSNSQGILAAEVLFFLAQPAAGNTAIFKNAALTRTYTFVANQGAESVATDVSIETDAATAMERLVTRMNADATNTQWTGIWAATGAERINAGGAIVVYERASAAGASASRIYGVQVNAKVVQFASGATPTVDNDYTSIASIALPAADPGVGRFGLRRQATALVDGEIHLFLNGESAWIWDRDGGVWQAFSGGGNIPDATAASGGAGVKGKMTVDSDLGLAVSSGILSVKVDTDTIGFNAAGQLTAAGDSRKINVSAAVTKGDPVYISGEDTVASADAGVDAQAFVIGISLDGQASVGQPTKVVRDGVAAGILLSAIAGTRYWLADGGGLADARPTGALRQWRVGYALNATDLYVQLSDFGKGIA